MWLHNYIIIHTIIYLDAATRVALAGGGTGRFWFIILDSRAIFVRRLYQEIRYGDILTWDLHLAPGRPGRTRVYIYRVSS